MKNHMPLYQDIASIINSANEKTRFILVLLIDDQGLPITSSNNNLEQNDLYAATLAMVQLSIKRINNQMGFPDSAEITILDDKGRKIILRPFQVKNTYLSLVIVLPEADIAYKRWAKQTIRKIQACWEI